MKIINAHKGGKQFWLKAEKYTLVSIKNIGLCGFYSTKYKIKMKVYWYLKINPYSLSSLTFVHMTIFIKGTQEYFQSFTSYSGIYIGAVFNKTKILNMEGARCKAVVLV